MEVIIAQFNWKLNCNNLHSFTFVKTIYIFFVDINFLFVYPTIIFKNSVKKRVVIRRKRSELMMVKDQHTNYGEPHFGEGYLNIE